MRISVTQGERCFHSFNIYFVFISLNDEKDTKKSESSTVVPISGHLKRRKIVSLYSTAPPFKCHKPLFILYPFLVTTSFQGYIWVCLSLSVPLSFCLSLSTSWLSFFSIFPLSFKRFVSLQKEIFRGSLVKGGKKDIVLIIACPSVKRLQDLS